MIEAAWNNHLFNIKSKFSKNDSVYSMNCIEPLYLSHSCYSTKYICFEVNPDDYFIADSIDCVVNITLNRPSISKSDNFKIICDIDDNYLTVI